MLVANGAGVRGLGGSTTNSLKERGYTNIAAPTDATTGVENAEAQIALVREYAVRQGMWRTDGAADIEDRVAVAKARRLHRAGWTASSRRSSQ